MFFLRKWLALPMVSVAVCLFGLCSPQVAEAQVIVAPQPIVVQPVVTPVYPVGMVPVVPRPVVVSGYYAPAPVVVAGPVIAPSYVQQTVNATPNRTVVRTREYGPFSVFPRSQRVTVARNTPRGVVIRDRGF